MRNVLVGDVGEWVGIEPVGKIETDEWPLRHYEYLNLNLLIVVVSGDEALLPLFF